MSYRRSIYLTVILVSVVVSIINLTNEESVPKLLANTADPERIELTGQSQVFMPFVSKPRVVNTTADGTDFDPGDGFCETGPGNNVCTLRAFIQETNAQPGPDTIVVPAGHYKLTITGEGEDNAATGDLDILDELTIVGANAATTVIDGNQIDRVFHIIGIKTSISNVTVTNGDASGEEGGGGILNGRDIDYKPGRLILEDVVVNNNKTTGIGGNNSSGGGIYSLGPITITNSIISNNQSVYGHGGGIRSTFTLYILDSMVSNNISSRNGGGIAAEHIVLINSIVNNNIIGANGPTRDGGGINIGTSGLIDNSVIRNNSVTNGPGGGIYIGVNATVTITQSEIMTNVVSGNSTANDGGGIYSDSNQTVTIIDTSIKGNSASLSGGGIYNNSEWGQMNLERVSIRENGTEGFGAGIYNAGNLDLTNVTLARNRAVGMFNEEGGGIYHKDAFLRITNSTLAENTAEYGGAIFIISGNVVLENTILTDNTAFGIILPGEPDTHNCSGPITSGGYNLEDGTDCFFAGTGDISGVNALLLPLSTSAPWTDFYPLGNNSPAIDHGGNTNCPSEDQRGVTRPIDGDGNGSAICDIGSYEYP
jgi:predicted outer membrane repeat protein